MNDKSNENFKIFINSFGEPAPDEIIEASKHLAKIFSKLSIKEEDDLEELHLPEEKNFRGIFEFVNTVTRRARKRLENLENSLNHFLEADPDDNISSEELIKMIKNAKLAAKTVHGLDNLIDILPDGMLELVVGLEMGEDISYGELLDMINADDDPDFYNFDEEE